MRLIWSDLVIHDFCVWCRAYDFFEDGSHSQAGSMAEKKGFPQYLLWLNLSGISGIYCYMHIYVNCWAKIKILFQVLFHDSSNSFNSFSFNGFPLHRNSLNQMIVTVIVSVMTDESQRISLWSFYSVRNRSKQNKPENLIIVNHKLTLALVLAYVW